MTYAKVYKAALDICKAKYENGLYKGNYEKFAKQLTKAVLEEHLTDIQLVIYNFLQRTTKGGATAYEIAASIKRNKSTVYTCLKAMEEYHLVYYETHNEVMFWHRADRDQSFKSGKAVHRDSM